ncbi:unnamed protein product, partial [Adineta steineri]
MYNSEEVSDEGYTTRSKCSSGYYSAISGDSSICFHCRIFCALYQNGYYTRYLNSTRCYIKTTEAIVFVPAAINRPLASVKRLSAKIVLIFDSVTS